MCYILQIMHISLIGSTQLFTEGKLFQQLLGKEFPARFTISTTLGGASGIVNDFQNLVTKKIHSKQNVKNYGNLVFRPYQNFFVFFIFYKESLSLFFFESALNPNLE